MIDYELLHDTLLGVVAIAIDEIFEATGMGLVAIGKR